MRNPSILSGTTPKSAAATLMKTRASAKAVGATAAAGVSHGGAALFDACQIGVVLRAVLFVEAVVAIATLFVAPALSDWLTLAALVTGGALPATLLWLVLACALKKALGRLSRPVQYAIGILLGSLSAL